MYIAKLEGEEVKIEGIKTDQSGQEKEEIEPEVLGNVRKPFAETEKLERDNVPEGEGKTEIERETDIPCIETEKGERNKASRGEGESAEMVKGGGDNTPGEEGE